MAMEIESLDLIATELTHESNAIKNILDMKQTEGVRIKREATSTNENQPTIDTSF